MKKMIEKAVGMKPKRREMSGTRRFDGKNFYRSSRHKKKSSADNYADRRRKGGDLARVVKGNDGYWHVYVRSSILRRIITRDEDRW